MYDAQEGVHHPVMLQSQGRDDAEFHAQAEVHQHGTACQVYVDTSPQQVF